MKFRKKPQNIEAIQFKRDCFEDVKEFTNGKAFNFRTERCMNGRCYCDLRNLNRVMTVVEGEYIIKDASGGFFTCKPDSFEKDYEKVE